MKGYTLPSVKIVKIKENNYQILKTDKNGSENFHNVGKTYSLRGLAGKVDLRDIANSSMGIDVETFSDLFEYFDKKNTDNKKFKAYEEMYGNPFNGDRK